MRSTDPFLRRRLRLQVAFRLAARILVSDQAAEDATYRWWKTAVSVAVDLASCLAAARNGTAQPPAPVVAAFTAADAVVWSAVGGDAPINARGLAIVGVSTAIEAGYRLGADNDQSLAVRLRNVTLSAGATFAVCAARRWRRLPPGWGLLGWPALGAAGGYALARYTGAEEQRRRRIAADLEAELIQVAKFLGASDHAEATAWSHVTRLEHGLLTLARFDATIAEDWRSLVAAAPSPPPDYVRLTRVVGEVAGDDNPLLHPCHAATLGSLGASESTVRALPSPGLTRPGERLDVDIDGRRVVLPPTRYRLGSDTADRLIDPAPLALAWAS